MRHKDLSGKTRILNEEDYKLEIDSISEELVDFKNKVKQIESVLDEQ